MAEWDWEDVVELHQWLSGGEREDGEFAWISVRFNEGSFQVGNYDHIQVGLYWGSKQAGEHGNNVHVLISILIFCHLLCYEYLWFFPPFFRLLRAKGLEEHCVSNQMTFGNLLIRLQLKLKPVDFLVSRFVFLISYLVLLLFLFVYFLDIFLYGNFSRPSSERDFLPT